MRITLQKDNKGLSKLDFTAYKSEHICRFPLPSELPPLWITQAGITHGNGQEETGISIEYVLSGTGVIQAGEIGRAHV